MKPELPIFHAETERLMHKVNVFADTYASAFDDICSGKPDANKETDKRVNQLRRDIRSALTSAYLDGCREVSAELQNDNGACKDSF